jgi:YbgC/YbaW family acyl-CoA thioester hydrolase
MGHRTVSRFNVRSYEVDSYRHLNNGVYVSWFEQGRLEFLASLGFSYDGFADRREWFVVARTEVDFRRPLTVADEVRLSSEVEAFGRSSVRWRQVMRQVLAGDAGGAAADADDDPVAAEAVTVMVFHGEDGRSIPIPADFRAAVEGP